MEEIGAITWVLILLNGAMTYKGLKSKEFFNRYAFDIDRVLIDRDYKRLISSGFLHVNWTHFIFNMITLFLFSQSLEPRMGMAAFSLLYFGSLLGGNLLALYIHRNHSDYRAVGASGAVIGLIFASIALFPGSKIGFILIPISFPAWLFGIAYVLYSIYGIRSQSDNIGHEAHLGGGITGLLIAIILYPEILIANYLPIFLILIPSLLFLFLIVKKPHILWVSNPLTKNKGFLTTEDKYNIGKANRQKELDRLLEKIHKKGYDQLSKKEREKLKNLSN